MPFRIAVLVGQGAASDLKEAHRHARPDLGQLDALPACPHKHMMADLDAILDVLERHHAAADLGVGRGRLARGEHVLEDLHDALAERGGEVLEDQMRVGFRDGAARRAGEVVAEQHVVQAKGGGGPVGEMRDGERRRGAAVLMQQEQIGERAGVGAGHERGKHERAAVEPDGCWQQEADFFGKGRKPGRGRARGGDERAGIDNAGEVRVFVVEGERFRRRQRRFVVGLCSEKGGVRGERRGEGLSGREGGFEGGSLGGCFGGAESEGPSVEVVSSFAGLFSLWLGGRISRES